MEGANCLTFRRFHSRSDQQDQHPKVCRFKNSQNRNKGGAHCTERLKQRMNYHKPPEPEPVRTCLNNSEQQQVVTGRWLFYLTPCVQHHSTDVLTCSTWDTYIQPLPPFYWVSHGPTFPGGWVAVSHGPFQKERISRVFSINFLIPFKFRLPLILASWGPRLEGANFEFCKKTKIKGSGNWRQTKIEGKAAKRSPFTMKNGKHCRSEDR